jgi:RNA polymerase II C-terminal domain phosphatase-like 3/4
LDSDAPEKSESVAAEGSGDVAPAAAAEEVEVDYDQRVGSILEELEMISIEEAEKYGWMLHVFVEGWLRFWTLRKTSFRAAVLQVV